MSTATAQNPDDMFAMSDDEFLKMSAPPVVEASAVEEKPTITEEPNKDEPVVDPSLVQKDDEPKPEDTTVDPDKKDEDGGAGKEEDGEGEKAKPSEAEADPTKTADPNKKVEEPKKEEATPPNYEVLYGQIMAPFKANGREIKLNSPEEAIKLMQMGANYTRKMQDLAPKMKLVTMLDNNKVSESELSYLLDLKNKDPEAIKKLIKDSGIDPLDINTAEPSSYKPNNHSVDDRQVVFNEKVDELKSSEDGIKTLVEINNNWDDVSKEALWNSPELMDVFHQQRQNGIYPQIATEMERQRTLGLIPRNIPFIEAYKRCGDQMVAAQTLKAPEIAKPAPVAENRVVVPKTDPNADRVKAAASVKETPAKKQESINYLAMSDEDFLKQMQNRV